MLNALVACVMMVPPPAGTDVDGILRAIAEVESNHNDNAVGDGGDSIGRYQIKEVYWKDAIAYKPSIGGQYEDCRDPVYAREVVIAYMCRYAPNWKIETIGGIHNGGPRGYLRAITKDYRRKVKKAYGN